MVVILGLGQLEWLPGTGLLALLLLWQKVSTQSNCFIFIVESTQCFMMVSLSETYWGILLHAKKCISINLLYVSVPFSVQTRQKRQNRKWFCRQLVFFFCVPRYVVWITFDGHLYFSAASCGEWIDDIDFRINHALIICKRRGYVKAGDYCILVTGSMEGPGWTNTVRTISVPDQDTLTQKYVNLVNQTHLAM